MTYDQARDIVLAIVHRYDMPNLPLVRDCALALMKAVNDERERAAKIADDHYGVTGMLAHQCSASIASAIRGGA